MAIGVMRNYGLNPAIRITVSGDERQIGKTTVAKLIGLLLKGFGYEVSNEEPTQVSQRYLDRMPIDVTKLESRRVVISST